MRAIVAGTRYFDDYRYLNEVLRYVFLTLQGEGYNINREVMEIVTNRDKGVAGLARLFSDVNRLELKIMYSGDAPSHLAHYVRNENMINYALEDPQIGVLVALHDEVSTITADLINQARMRGMRMFIFNPNKR